MNLSQIRSLLEDKQIIDSTNKIQYLVKCPFHNEQNGTALFISFKKNQFKCFSGKCIPKNVKGDLVKLCAMLGFLQQKIQITIPKFAKEKEKKVFTEPELFNLENFTRFHNKHDFSYLKGRGFSKEICEINKCSYSNYTKRFYTPFWYEKKCYGIVGRTILNKGYYEHLLKYLAQQENEQIEIVAKLLKNGFYDEKYKEIKQFQPYVRYKNSYQLPKEALIFEPLSNKLESKYLIVTEGQYKSMKCNEYGENSCAILGSNPTKFQIERIYNLAKKTKSIVVLGFDNCTIDKAGEENKNLFRKLYGSLVLSFNWKILKEKIKDIDELSLNQFNFLKGNLTYF